MIRAEIILKSINLRLENYKDEMCPGRPGSANVKLDDLADSRFSSDSCCVCTYQDQAAHTSHQINYK